MNHYQKHLKLLYIALSVLLVGNEAFSQSKNAVKVNYQQISLQTAVQAGLDHSNLIKASKARLEGAEGRVQQSRNDQIPQIAISANYTRLSNNVTPLAIQLPGSDRPFTLNPQILDNYYNKASVTEKLFDGFRIQNQKQSAQLLKAASEADMLKDHSDVKLTVISAYYQVYKLQMQLGLLDENLRQVQENISNTENNNKAGIGTENDVLRIKLQKTNIELTKVETQNALKSSRFMLATLMGVEVGQDISIDTNVTGLDNHIVSDFDALSSQATTTRPELRAASLRLQAAQKDYEVAKAPLYPTLTAGANFYYANPAARIFPATAVWKGTWDAGLSLSYNIANLYTGRAGLFIATANQKQQAATQQYLLENINIQLKQQQLALEAQQEKIVVAKKAIAQAAENYRVTNNKYKADIAILSDLLDASLLSLMAKISYTNALADAEIAWYNLQYATGALATTTANIK